MKRRNFLTSFVYLALISILSLTAPLYRAAGAAPAVHQADLSPGEIKARLYVPVIAAPWVPPYTPPNWSGPAGGSVVCLAGDPHNQNILYAGTWGGGVFRSTDQGNNWTWASAGLRNFLIDSLVVDPTDSRILYAGTHGAGVFKSENRGDSWSFAGMGLQEDAIVYSIAVHPGNNQVLFAATRKSGFGLQPPYYGVLYKSTNGGQLWYPVMDEIGGTGARDWIYSIAIKPSDPSLILVASHEHGPYLSSHGGEMGDWFPVPAYGLSAYTKGRSTIFDPRSDSQAAFFATWHGGFYKSNNNGASFDLAASSLDMMKIYPNSISFAVQKPNIMYMASMDTASGVLKSTNNGSSWTSIGLRSEDLYSTISPDDGDVVFAGTVANGLFKSINGGTSWFRAISGMVITQVTSLAAPASDDLYLGVQGRGVFHSLDGGQTWTDFNTGLDDLNVRSLVETGGASPGLLALTPSGQVWRTNTGSEANWTRAGDGAPEPTLLLNEEIETPSPWVLEPMAELRALETGGVSPYADPGPSTWAASIDTGAGSPSIYLGLPGTGLLSSADGGASFTPASLGGQSVRALAQDPTHPNLLAAASGRQVFLSKDYGASWSELPEAQQPVLSLAFSSGTGQVLLAGTSGGIAAWDGREWARFGLEGQAIFTLATDPWQRGWAWAGTQGSTYLLKDTTAAPAWTAVPELQGCTTSVIRFAPDRPGTMYFGTTGRGLLTIDLAQMP